MKATPLERALQELAGMGAAVRGKNLQRLVDAKRQPAPSPDAETHEEEGGQSEEELARLLTQYAESR